MKKAEAMKLKQGDLVVMQKRAAKYAGMVLEVDNVDPGDWWRCLLTLKQPGFETGFRIEGIDSRMVDIYVKE